MTGTAPQPSLAWDEVSSELALVFDEQGVIRGADARAERMLHAREGGDLLALAVPGAEAKLRSFMERALVEPVRGWELSLLAFSAPRTVCVHTRRTADGLVHLHGTVLPEGFGETVRQLNEALDEVVDLNRQLAQQRKELAQRHAELERAYHELDESNRGVIALHAELADHSDSLRRTSDVKSRVVANVSHEFRTPLHTILGLSRLLLDGVDAPLTVEQEKQVRFIRTSAEELSRLVNDMLDLARTESGKAILRPEKFRLTDHFAAMRGALRPLVTNENVELSFDEPAGDIALETDHGKLSQIVRNLVSNALKFTERGAVHVRAHTEGEDLLIRVSDTGIGIAPQHFEQIFEEFGQIEGPLQSRVKGTGLGLPIARKLAELLDGTLVVESEVGKGSTFTLRIPRVHPEVRELAVLERRPLDPERSPVLVVEDDRKTIFIYEKFLAMAGFQVVPARSVDNARKLLDTLRPAAIVLDIMLEGESSWEFLAELKRNKATADIPVLVVTVTAKEQKARALGADEFWLKPVDQDRLLRKLRSLTQPGSMPQVLVIDDDERARYLVRKYLERTPYRLLEAATGPAGVRAAHDNRPDVILLDFLLQDMTAFDVIDELKGDPVTRAIPVIVVTSHALDRADRERLASHAEAILSKENLSRELAINRIRDALQKAGVRGSRDGRGGPHA